MFGLHECDRILFFHNVLKTLGISDHTEVFAKGAIQKTAEMRPEVWSDGIVTRECSVRENPRQRRDCGNVGTHVLRIDLVERVRRRVVIVEVVH